MENVRLLSGMHCIYHSVKELSGDRANTVYITVSRNYQVTEQTLYISQCQGTIRWQSKQHKYHNTQVIKWRFSCLGFPGDITHAPLLHGCHGAHVREYKDDDTKTNDWFEKYFTAVLSPSILTKKREDEVSAMTVGGQCQVFVTPVIKTILLVNHVSTVYDAAQLNVRTPVMWNIWID
jgi:hypothetical protein